MSMAEAETRSRPSRIRRRRVRRRANARRVGAPVRPHGGSRSSGGKPARAATRWSGVDWTLPIRRRLDRSGAWISETEALVAAVSRVVNVEADAEIVRVDETLSECRLLSDDRTCRHIPLKAARPQILALQLPG